MENEESVFILLFQNYAHEIQSLCQGHRGQIPQERNKPGDFSHRMKRPCTNAQCAIPFVAEEKSRRKRYSGTFSAGARQEIHFRPGRTQPAKAPGTSAAGMPSAV